MQSPDEHSVFCRRRRCRGRRRKQQWWRNRRRKYRGGNGGNQPKSFDDWLAANKEYQAEFDRRIQKALNTQKDKLEVLYSEKTTEAEKLAMMTKEEKAQYLAQKHEKELDEREAGITRRELMAEAKNTLAEKKLPVGLAEVLNYTDADSCNKSIAAVEKAFHRQPWKRN